MFVRRHGFSPRCRADTFYGSINGGIKTDETATAEHFHFRVDDNDVDDYGHIVMKFGR